MDLQLESLIFQFLERQNFFRGFTYVKSLYVDFVLFLHNCRIRSPRIINALLAVTSTEKIKLEWLGASITLIFTIPLG